MVGAGNECMTPKYLTTKSETYLEVSSTDVFHKEPEKSGMLGHPARKRNSLPKSQCTKQEKAS